ncbi:MAG: hypothetical protein CMK25_02765 [Porticoccaceae bacterium]|nr:hypothetical protein [Porticoccaceae bacterium]|tara:strand:- start:667 stop:846 length:180 start_codon:yes stop_codon:yes gene_type:complete
MKWSLEDVFQNCILIYFEPLQGRKSSKMANIFILWFSFTKIHIKLTNQIKVEDHFHDYP